MQEILSPLLTCRQFYTEAMPIFYRSNLFYCENTRTLHYMLKRLPESRLAHLEQIAFHYFPWWDEEDIEETFKALATLNHLRTLKIHLDEAHWMRYFSGKENRDLLYMRAIPTLRKLRRLKEVTFVGSPTLEEIVKPELLLPKDDQEASKKGKKRKADEERPKTK
jgi:hypothetical protein